MYHVRDEYELLVHTYYEKLYRFIYGYCKNSSDAEDVVQVAYLRLLETDKKFESQQHVKNWLYQVAVNCARDLLKSRWYKREKMPDDLAWEQKEQADLFEEIRKLPDKYRVVVLLYYYEEYSIREISEITGVRETTIQTRLQRAREKLKNILEREWNYE